MAKKYRREMNDRIVTVLGIVLVALVLAGFVFVAVSNSRPVQTTPSASETVQSGTPDLTPTHYVQFDIQDFGTVTAELYGNEAPHHRGELRPAGEQRFL